jgi:hypothetical protein
MSDEAYQEQLDIRAKLLADLAVELVEDPNDAFGQLSQASMIIALRTLTLRQYADVQLAAAEISYVAIQTRLLEEAGGVRRLPDPPSLT